MAPQPTTEIEIHSPTACIVTLRGEHDVASSEAITLALTLARRSTDVLVDLAGCAFVDSSVISVLLLAARRAHEQGGRLELVVPVETTAVRRTLEISNVQGSLPFHATREDGIAALAAPRRAGPRSAVAEPSAPTGRASASARGGVTVVRARIAADPPRWSAAGDLDPGHAPPQTGEERRAA
jgi:anti-anti-sigma factor